MKRTNANTYIHRLALKIYKSKPVRNGLIMATITLMTCLVMSVAGVFEAASYLMQQENLRTFGTIAEGKYTGIDKGQYEALTQYADITEIAGETYLGSVEGEMGDTQVSAFYASEKCAGMNFHKLLSGKWPTSGHEVVVDSIYAQEHEVEIGQTISVAAEFFEGRECTVTGICAANKKQGSAVLYFYVQGQEIPEEVPENRLNLIAYCTFAEDSSPKEILKSVSSSEQQEKSQFVQNPVYEMETGSLENFIKKAVLLVCCFAIVFLTITSLYRIFIFRDVELFGRLKTVGVTDRQCRWILTIQSLCQSLIGIPAGILLGVCFDFLFLPGILKKYYGGLEGYRGVPIQSVGFAVLIVLIAMVFGMRKPLAILRKISPIQAAGYMGSLQSENSRKSGKVSLFRMATRYAFWEKGRSLLVMGSVFAAVFFLTLSVALTTFLTQKLMGMRSLQSAFLIGEKWYCKHVSEIRDDEKYDYPPNVDRDDAWAIDRNVYDALWEYLPEAEVTPVFYNYGMNFSEDVTERVKEALQDNEISDDGMIGKSFYEKRLSDWENPSYTPYWDEMRYYITFETLAKCRVLEGELNYDKWKSGNYVVMGANPLMNENGTLYHAGEKVTLYLYEEKATYTRREDGFTEIEKGVAKEYEVLAVVDELPAVCAYRQTTLVTLLPAENIPPGDNSFKLCALMIDARDLKGTEEKIQEFISEKYDRLYYVSNRVMKEESREQVGMIRLIGGSFALILLGTAFMNVLNYILLCLTERAREYRTLWQVGMTRKQIRKMHLFEYGSLLLIPILLGLATASGVFLFISKWINTIL
ncbi:MAG: FtsX-like permease family protein [Lachnospiraceae bacterium]